MQPSFAARFLLLQPLAQGHQSLSFRVLDTLLQQHAVLKLGRSGVEDEDRTLAEFDALRAAHHPHIAPVIELGFASPGDVRRALRFANLPPDPHPRPRPFLVRAWIDGPDLLHWAASQHPDLNARAHTLAILALTLHHLHDAHLLHGDLKPDHVLIPDPLQPALIDFGLAALTSDPTSGGTPGYLAPERLRGRPASPHADRFAFGVLAAQTLAGQRLHLQPAQHLDDLPPELQHLPHRLKNTLRRLLDPDPAQRPRLDDVATDLLPPDLVDLPSPLGVHTTRHLPFLAPQRLQNLHKLLTPEPPTALLIVAPDGAGRTRTLQHLTWNLQRRAIPVLRVAPAHATEPRVLQLAAQLAALHDLDTPRQPAPRQHADRAARLLHLASLLLDAAPTTPVVLLADDLHLDPDLTEVLTFAIQRAQGRLRLAASTHPDHLPHLLDTLTFAATPHLLHLEPLAPEDLQPLHAAFPLPLLRDALQRAHGLPATLLHLLYPATPHADDDAHPPDDRDAALLAIAGLLPGGLAIDDLPALANPLHLSLTTLRATLQRLLQLQRLTPLPQPDAQPRYAATPPHLLNLPTHLREPLAYALHALTPQHPLLAIPAAALFQRPDDLRAAWEQHRHALPRLASLASALLEPALLLPPLPDLLDAWTSLTLDAGLLEQGARTLEHAASLQPHPALRAAQARLAFAAGDLQRAAALLTDLPTHDLPTHDLTAPHAAHLLAQIDLRQGRYAEAHQRALHAAHTLQHLDHDSARNLRADLLATASAANAFLGQPDDDGLQHTDLHQTLRDAPPRTQARLLAMQALAAYIRGHLDQAIDRYRLALDLVEDHHLQAEKPLYLLNLATAWERQGRLSVARQLYNDGIRASAPSTRPSTRALLLANRANVDIKLGRTAEARELLATALRIAQHARLTAVERFIQHLHADADAADDHPLRALDTYTRCAQDYLDSGDRRHAAELLLKAGLAAARAQQPEPARDALQRAEPLAVDFPDLQPIAAILHAQLLLLRGGFDALAGVDRYLRALERALDLNDDLTVLTEARHLRRALLTEPHLRDPLAEQQLLAITQRAWRRVAIALAADLRRDFARFLQIDDDDAPALTPPLPTPAAPPMPNLPTPHLPDPPQPTPDTAARFYRMLSLNRRILGEPDLQRLIPAALDIALELAAAERGFLLLRDDPDQPLRVAFSRDLDGRALDHAHLQVSSTLAQQVASTGEPISSINPWAEPRFQGVSSLTKIRPTAVLCVPITDRDTLLGCLYLDHRDNPLLASPDTARMIGAYADQVAVALLTAWRLRDLQHERDRLREAQERIQHLLDEKELLLTDLHTRCHQLEAEVARERSSSSLRYDYSHLIAQAPAMRAALERVDRITDTDLPVVIYGESGTGKELIARALHANGPRRHKPFVAVNCGALTESLLEAELFGYKKGAFTGATTDRPGLFEAAHGGTLFLDELGEMSPAMQVKLLRALQEQRIRPVGALHEITVDVRILAATHRDLSKMMHEQTFREDLYYRLATLVIELPPLRHRVEDIPLLVQRALRSACATSKRPEPHVGGDALQLLLRYPWPGNIRQLENTLRAAVALSGDTIEAHLLQTLLQSAEPPAAHSRPAAPPKPRVRRGATGRPPKVTLDQARDALQRYPDDRQAAADSLGVSVRTLARYLQRLG